MTKKPYELIEITHTDEKTIASAKISKEGHAEWVIEIFDESFEEAQRKLVAEHVAVAYVIEKAHGMLAAEMMRGRVRAIEGRQRKISADKMQDMGINQIDAEHVRNMFDVLDDDQQRTFLKLLPLLVFDRDKGLLQSASELEICRNGACWQVA